MFMFFYAGVAYQSHLIIEMIYDIVISNQINFFNAIDFLTEEIDFTVKNKMDEFVATINWLYDVKKIEKTSRQ